MKFSDVFVYMVIFVLATFGTQAEEPESFRLHGQILNSAGDPIAGAIVTIGTPPTFFERERTDLCRAGTDGRFTLGAVYPPPFKISVSHDEYLPISKEISRAEGKSAEPTEPETECGVVEGRRPPRERDSVESRREDDAGEEDRDEAVEGGA